MALVTTDIGFREWLPTSVGAQLTTTFLGSAREIYQLGSEADRSTHFLGLRNTKTIREMNLGRTRGNEALLHKEGEDE